MSAFVLVTWLSLSAPDIAPKATLVAGEDPSLLDEQGLRDWSEFATDSGKAAIRASASGSLTGSRLADSGGPRGARPRRASTAGSQYSGTGSQTRPCRLPSRVAGSLLLLFAQPVTRIVRLTIDDVVQVGDHTALRLGDPPTPSHSPECLPRGSAQHDHRHQLRLLLALPQPPRRTGHGPGTLREFDVPVQRAR